MILFDFTLFGHNYGVGYNIDFTLLRHILIYGGTVFLVAWVTNKIVWGLRIQMSVYSISTGLAASLVSAFYLELMQMYQYHYKTASGDHVGMFGVLDWVVSWLAAYIVYRVMRAFVIRKMEEMENSLT